MNIRICYSKILSIKIVNKIILPNIQVLYVVLGNTNILYKLVIKVSSYKSLKYIIPTNAYGNKIK